MVRSSGSRLYPYIYQVRHVKMQALITDYLISKRWGKFYSDHLECDLPQDKGYESNPVTFPKYLANLTAKTGKYAGDQLFHAISRDNDPTTVYFMYFTHHEVSSDQVLNRLPYILYEELLITPNYSIVISVIKQAAIGIWDKKSTPSPTQMRYIMGKQWKVCSRLYSSRH